MKNTILFNLTAGLLAIVLLSSCSAIYAPSQPHMPMVSKANVTEINASLGMGDWTSTFDLNAFHSVSDHVGVMLNFNTFSGYDDDRGQTSIDAGAGYFARIEGKW